MNSAVLGADFETGLNLRDEIVEALWGDRPFADDVSRRNLQFFRNITFDGSGQICVVILLQIYVYLVPMRKVGYAEDRTREGTELLKDVLGAVDGEQIPVNTLTYKYSNSDLAANL